MKPIQLTLLEELPRIPTYGVYSCEAGGKYRRSVGRYKTRSQARKRLLDCVDNQLQNHAQTYYFQIVEE